MSCICGSEKLPTSDAYECGTTVNIYEEYVQTPKCYERQIAQLTEENERIKKELWYKYSEQTAHELMDKLNTLAYSADLVEVIPGFVWALKELKKLAKSMELELTSLRADKDALKIENKTWLEISANTFPYVMQAVHDSPKHVALRATIKDATTITHEDLAKIIRSQAVDNARVSLTEPETPEDGDLSINKDK